MEKHGLKSNNIDPKSRLYNFLKTYPEISLATNEDNISILDFFLSAQMSTKDSDLVYDRSPDFFALNRLRGPGSFTLVSKVKGVVTGIATISLREGLFKGEIQTVGYLSDFRIGFDRRALRLWRKAYGDLLRTLKTNFQCKHLLTAIIDDNKLARKVLAGKHKTFEYREIARYKMVNIALKWRPRLRRPRSAENPHQVSLYGGRDPEQLLNFLTTTYRTTDFAPSPSEIQRRLQTWSGFKLESFVVATDSSGKIVGCFLPWRPQTEKQMWLTSVPFHYKFCSLFPRAKEPIHLQYLTHRCFSATENQDAVFASMLDWYWQNSEDKGHGLSLYEFDNQRISPLLKNYLTVSVPMRLYTVQEPGDQILCSHSNPYFDMALV